MIKKFLLLPLFIFSISVSGQFYSRTHLDSIETAAFHKKGVDRVDALLILSNAYKPFDLDSALAYAKIGRKEALKHNYSWGYCKSYYQEASVMHQTGDINKVRSILEVCSKWFVENGYEVDAIYCDLLLTRCLNTLEGTDLARKRANSILERSRIVGSVKLLAASWFEMERHKPTLLADNKYPWSIDSAVYYFNLSNDSVRILSGIQYKMMTKIGTEEAFQCSREAYEKSRKWGNKTGILTALWCQLYGHLVMNNLDSSVYYCEEIVDVSRDLGSKAQETIGLKTLAYAYSRADSVLRALDCYNASNLLNEELGWRREQCQNLSMVGSLYISIEDYEPAAKALVEAIKIAEDINEQHTFYSSKRMLAELYIITENYEKAEHAYIETLEWMDTSLAGTTLKSMRGRVHSDLAKMYQDQGQFAMSRKYSELAITDFYTQKPIINAELSIVETYLDEKNEEMAIAHFEKVTNKYDPVYFLEMSNFHRVKGRIYMRQGKYDEGIYAFETHLNTTQKNLVNEERLYTYKELSEAYSENGQYEKALSTFTIYKSIEDSLRVSDVEDNIVKIQSDYEISLKETEIKGLYQQQELQDLRLDRQNRKLELRQSYIVILIFIGLLIALLSLWLFRRFRLKKEREKIVMKTKRVELEFENLQAKQKVELAEVKNTLFANVSHEFRTPLTLIQVPIKNHLEKANEEDKVMFQSVLNNTEGLLKMVDELLDLAKIETGTVTLQKSPFHLDHFFVQVKANFSVFFQEKNIRFMLENRISNQVFFADENRLKIVMNNLLKNAFVHTPEGGEVSCSVKRENDALIIAVHNTGKAIPENELKLIFDRHYRGHTEDYVGNGIGLSLSKQIIELHDGEIIVKNNESSGVIFTIIIPGEFKSHSFIKPQDIIKKDELKIPNEAALYNPIDEVEKPTVLIVEDNQEMMALLQSILDNEFNLSFAKNGIEGEKIAFDLQPDLILSDIMMPKKDGIELLISIKSHITTSHIPVILLTAKSAIESRIVGFNLNADDYISKPFDANELKARIFNILRQRKKLQTLFTEKPFLLAKDIKCTPLDAEFLEKAVKILEKHYSDGDFVVLDFCRELALNRNSVHNKIKAFTNQTTSEYIQNFRLEKAIRLLIGSNNSISNIYMDVGFNSPQAFNKAFKRRHHCTPTEYRNQNQ
ncbi:MAG: signal transduction histidine kinase/AraC-like DNA-binding protein [Crocinitomix sp.]|jgi:signal transduction histidine kinase/AraC-like DNA-binding protein